MTSRMIRTKLFAVLAALCVVTAGHFAQAQVAIFQPAGVEIDAEGVLRTRLYQDPSRQLTQQRYEAAKNTLPGDVIKTSDLRKVSLNRLEKAIAAKLDSGEGLNDVMRNMAGLTQITHVFYYPETKDIVIAGPAEGFFRDLSGRWIGMESGKAIMQLEDMLVALRAYAPQQQSAGVIGCSIDPTKEGLAQFQAAVNELAAKTRTNEIMIRGNENMIVDTLKQSLGKQVVTIQGVPANTHFGQVLVEADYRMQMIGIGSAQALLLAADPGGFILFIIPSMLVSLAFAPILLSVSPTPAFASTKPMSLREIMKVSPLGCVGMFLLGGVFAAQFSMAAIYGAEANLTIAEISTFVSTFYIGALLLQYPIGWLSDRMDRRVLIFVAAIVCGTGAAIGMLLGGIFAMLLISGLLIGGMAYPLYSLLMAYTNDLLEPEDMAAASGGMVFINGLGAVAGPLVNGWMISVFGPPGYFAFIAILALAMAGYAAYRMTQRAAPSTDETGTYAAVPRSASPLPVEFAINAAQDKGDG